MTTDSLAEAAARLGDPTITWTVTENTAGIKCEGEYQQDALLKQLRDAVMTGRESKGGGASIEDRLPYDDVALTMYREIKAGIDRWWKDLTGKAGYPKPEQTLREWVREISPHRGSSVLDAFKEAYFTVQLKEWADQIRGYFDPPRLIEITEPCPTCGDRWTEASTAPRWQDQVPASQDEKMQIAALVVSWPRGEGVTIDDATARCRACGDTWEGQRMRFLSHDIDVAKRRQPKADCEPLVAAL